MRPNVNSLIKVEDEHLLRASNDNLMELFKILSKILIE